LAQRSIRRCVLSLPDSRSGRRLPSCRQRDIVPDWLSKLTFVLAIMAFGVLKVSSGGQIHRVLLEHEPSFSSVDAVLQGLRPGMRPGSAKYLDADGDLCSLVEGTFEDFLIISGCQAGKKDRTILKITIEDDAAPARTVGLQAPEARGNANAARARPIARRKAARQPVLQTTWEEDRRDLEELLCQLEDEPESEARSKRQRQKARKREARAALKQQEEAASSSVDSHVPQAGLEGGNPEPEQDVEDADHASEQEDLEAEYWGEETADPEAEYWGEDQNLYPDEAYWEQWCEEDPDPDAQYWGEEEAPDLDCQYGWGVDHPEYSAQTGSWLEDLAELLGPYPDLPRASSCPCLPTCSPLLDDDEDPDIEDFFDDPSLPLTLWPPTPDSTPSPTPRHQYHNTDPQQQVVWVPVPMAAFSHLWYPHGQQ